MTEDVLDSIELAVQVFREHLVRLAEQGLDYSFKPEFHGKRGQLREAKWAPVEIQHFPAPRGGRKGPREANGE